jgi:hypothetical protein
VTPSSGVPIERALLEETIARLRAELAPGRGSCTIAFAGEVVRQVAHPLGAAPAADRAAAERRVADDLLALLCAAFDGGAARAEAARRLSREPVVLAALFQNLDLLVECPSGHAGAVAALVAGALDAPG